MVCIYCSAETSVINSRPQKRTNHIWRRRQCADCKAVFTTSEFPDLSKAVVVVRESVLQPFSRDKLFLSIHSSLKHRKTALADASGLTDTILSHLYPKIASGSLHVAEITQTTLKTLTLFDSVAGTHYQAYHPLNARR